MKKLLFLENYFSHVFFCLVIVLFASCGHTNPPTGENPIDTVLPGELAIIKMSPEMQEKVFVSPIVDYIYRDSKTGVFTLSYGNGLGLCNPTHADSILTTFAQSELKILGTDPYIMLDNGYAIVDWKWSHFQPLSGTYRLAVHQYSNDLGHSNNEKGELSHPGYCADGYFSVSNEEYYLLPMHWGQLTNLAEVWPMEEGIHIEKPEIRYITFNALRKYGNLKVQDLPKDMYYFHQQFPTDDEAVATSIKECDEAQAAYMQTLNQMINNNDFETWTRTKQ